MDTRFWGPSGWRLLHMISFTAGEHKVSDLNTFFANIPFILPCKYCRASLTDYFVADPIPTHASGLQDPDVTGPWMFRIHNRVNGKLREQKLLATPDPKWSDIQTRYDAWLSAPCSIRRMIGWDFLFSVAYTTPSPVVPSAPMAGAPPCTALTTPELRNRWNCMQREERFPYIEAWWRALGHVLPFQAWKGAWAAALKSIGDPPVHKGRRPMTAWLYKMEKYVCQHLRESATHDSFEGLCTELSAFSSGCGTSTRSKTCRAKKRYTRATLRRRR